MKRCTAASRVFDTNRFCRRLQRALRLNQYPMFLRHLPPSTEEEDQQFNVLGAQQVASLRHHILPHA